MSATNLASRISELQIAYAIIADPISGTVVRIGDASDLSSGDLEAALFRDAETMFCTARSLEGQRLPRLWGQGQVLCVVCKPNEHTIVGAFCANDRGPAEAYLWAKQIEAAVAECFAP